MGILSAKNRGFWICQRLDAESVFLVPPGGQFCFVSPGELHWQSVHIPTELLFPINNAPEGSYEFSRVLKPGYGQINEFRTVVDRFAQAAVIEPFLMTEPASVANFSETLLYTARQILGIANPPAGHDRLTASHRQLISAAVQFIDDCPEESLSIKELAQIAGVSERTLRSAFVGYLGMAPMKYLSLRRLHHAREVLQSASPGELTVSMVAARFGFWDFGRFAGKYHRLFGEFPSETLRHPSGAPSQMRRLQ